MNVQYDLVVDFARPSKSNTIIVSEDDDKSRVLHFTLLSNKQPFSMLGVINAYIVGYKPDGTPLVDTTSNLEILKDSEGNKINEINYTIPKEVTAYSGNINMQIVLQGDDGSRITSFDFYVLVRNGLYNEAEMVDEDTYNGFRDLLTESELVLEQMKSYAQEATRPNPYPLSITIEDETTNYSGSASESVTIKDVAYIADDIDVEVDNLEESSVAQCAAYAETCLDAKDYAVNAISASQNAVSAANDAEFFKTSAGNSSLVSEGFASGTQDGVPVEADSPYYQNNAKYYADLANSGSPTWSNVTGKPFSTIGSGLVVDGGEVSVPKQRIQDAPDFVKSSATKGWLELFYNRLNNKSYVRVKEYYSDKDLMHETAEGQQIVQKPVYDCIEELYENGSTVKYGTSAEFEAYKQDDSVPVGTEYIVTDDYESGESSSKYDYDLITTGTLVETHPSLSNQKKVNEFLDGMVDLNKNNIGTLSQLSTSNKDNLVGAINEVFQDVSDGKELIADAITDKGITTSATDTFQTMATNISNISSSNPTVYDLNYVKDDMLFWVDGKSTGFLPYDDEELNETKQMVLKFVGSSVVNVANGNLGSLNTFIEGGGVNFPSRSSSSYVRFPSYIYTPSSVTFECYVKYDSMSSGNNECFSSRESGGWLLACLNGKPAFNTQLTNVSLVTTSPDDINVGEKHLLTGVVDLENGKQKLYVDGVEKASADITAGIKNQSTCIWLGNDGTGSSPESSSSTYAMIGAVYSARIYNKALTDAEVLQNYNVDKTRFGE